MSERGTVVHIYDSQSGAEEAIQRLQKAGYDVKTLSILYGDYRVEQRVVGFLTAGDRIRRWGKRGTLWGGVAGLTFAATSSVLSGFGAVLLVDPVSAWVEGALGGAIVIGGLSAMIAILSSMRSPNDSLVKYEVAVASDNEFVLIARAAEADVARAQYILEAMDPDEWETDATPYLHRPPSGTTGGRAASVYEW
jgi:hypothetical protein